MILSRTVLVLALSILTSSALAQPTLSINGVTAADNSAVPHATKLTPLTIELTGTPGAPFALLLSGDAFDGAQIGEPLINNGFFLRSWELPPVIDSPIHPVFDGIGMGYIRDQLNSQGDATLAADDVLLNTPSPIFRFDASGKFTLNAVTPTVAFLRNLTPSGPFPDPLVIALESTPGQQISLFMQVVELNLQTLGITSGNGVKLVFDALTYAAKIGYSEGLDLNQSSVTVANRQTLGTITDGDLTDGTIFAPVTAPDFSGTPVANLDIWRIALSGFHPLSSQSLSPVGANGLTAQIDPDSVAGIAEEQTYGSGMEVLTASVPQLRKENIEFTTIVLPGDRELFHWRDEGAGPDYGFGVFFRQTGEFKMVSPSVAGLANRSAWETEVGVTPDGNRALVIQDVIGDVDRVFMLNLESGADGLFENGLSYHDATPSLAGIELFFNRVFEESIVFASDGADSWVAFVCSTSSASASTAIYPNRMWRIWMKGSGSQFSPTTALQVLPGPAPLNPQGMDRQPVVSDDHSMVAISAGTSNNENVFLFSQITSFSQSLDNVTQFSAAKKLHETNDAGDGESHSMAFSPDGEWLALASFAGALQVPMLTRTDVSTAGSVGDLIADVGGGGLFDLSDFSATREYWFAKDSSHLVFHQGLIKNGGQADRFDLFTYNLQSGVVINRTATLVSETNIFGPFVAVNNTFDQPTIDPAGVFYSPNKDYLYWLRDARGLFQVGLDRMNLIAISIASPGPGQQASMDFINLTGTEFPAQPGGSVTGGGPDIIGDGTSGSEGRVGHYLNMRRIGGDGPFENFAYFKARQLGPSPTIDQLYLVDLNNPAPVLKLTDFSNGGGQYPVANFASILSITPSPVSPKVAFILDENGIGNTSSLQDLVVLDLAAFGTLRRVPDSAPSFARLITQGSLNFLDSGPEGLFYVSGSIPRGPGTIDGLNLSTDPTNPIDATAFFHRVDTPSSLFEIAPAAGASRRAAYIYGVTAQ